ncbi:MAG TPA: arsenite methyltransferase [Roseiflexaceae bacterium]|nr:arsenite methyltransferase [Roseiflexaceae bacterium]
MSQAIQDPRAIKEMVREHYGSRIQAASSSCCGPSAASSCCSSNSSASCCDTPTEVALYGAEALAALPADLTTTSFGCGNPIALASLKPGEVVLDLGSGGGLDVLLAAQRVGPEGYVYGLDMTDEMLAVARRNAEKAAAGNVEFLKGDIESIPLPDASVDVILSNCVINLSPDKGEVLREAFRVLRPGARLAVSDIVVDGDLTGLPVSELQIRAALSWAGCIAGALTIDQYRQLLAEAGFERIEIDIRQRYTAEDLLSDAPDTLSALPSQVVSELVGRFTSSAVTAWKPAR